MKSTIRIDVATIFPDYFAPLQLSLIGRAIREGRIDLRLNDLRDFAHDAHRTVDDAPFGGGAGMVMKPQPWAEALGQIAARPPGEPGPILLVPGPSGEPFNQAMARELAGAPWLAFACGRFEGIDERVYDYARDTLHLEVRIVSLGDYVLNGGEVAALAMIEAIARLVPGVIGNAASLVEESHEDGLLEYPLYTQPAAWDDGTQVREVPEVLRSGNHGAIAAWRHDQRLQRTASRRPDLLHPAGVVGSLAALDLRLAVPADVPELHVLTRACWVPEGRICDSHTIPPLIETLDDTAHSLTQWTTWVGRSHGRLVASVRGRLRDGDPTVWEIGRLMVAPDLQGRGLGRELLSFCEAAAPHSVTSFWLNTGAPSVANQRRYKRAGYRILPGEPRLPGTVDLTKRRPRSAG